MFFSMIICTVLLCTTGAGAVDIFSNVISIVLFLSKVYSSVILNDSNMSLSTSISMASCLYLSVLFIHSFYHNVVLIFP